MTAGALTRNGIRTPGPAAAAAVLVVIMVELVVGEEMWTSVACGRALHPAPWAGRRRGGGVMVWED